MKTLFVGGTKRGYLTLKALLDSGVDVVGIISLRQDEHEVERYEEPIKALAKNFNILHYETKWMNDRNYVDLISQQIQADIAFVVGCRILIPKEIYTIPPLGTLAVHDSLLPEYRGFAPLNWSIINGEDHVGVTLFYLAELMDGGDIVAQKRVPIAPDETAPVVYERVCHATIELVLEMCPLLAEDTAPRIKQDYSKGSFTCARTPMDGLIKWTDPVATIYNKVRALKYPYPGAFTYYTGKRIIIWSAKPHPNPYYYSGRIPGRVVGLSKQEGYVDVLTGDGVLRIFKVQFAREDRAMAANVIQSIRGTLGIRTVDLMNRIEALELKLACLMEVQS